MRYYTQNTIKTQHFAYTKPENCTTFSRCNNYKICPHCFKIWKNKQFKKATENLSEKRINKFKYKYFLTVVSMDKNINPYEKNSNIDLFLNDLTRNKRAKTNLFYQSEYLSVKQISYTEQYEINPHLHITLLTNKIFKRDKKIRELLSRYNLRINKQEIKKDIDNSFRTPILKIINYSLKFNPVTNDIESKYKLTKNKSYIKKSSLFSKKKDIKNHKNLLIYIYQLTATVKAFYTAKKEQAKKSFLYFNRKNPKTYIKALKSYKNKIEKIEKAQKYYENRIKSLNIYSFNSYTLPPFFRTYTKFYQGLSKNRTQ